VRRRTTMATRITIDIYSTRGKDEHTFTVPDEAEALEVIGELLDTLTVMESGEDQADDAGGGQ